MAGVASVPSPRPTFPTEVADVFVGDPVLPCASLCVQPYTITLFCMRVALLMCSSGLGFCQDATWTDRVRDYVVAQQLDEALVEVDARLAEVPGDLEAHGWRARLLAWKGSSIAAEAEYRLVLQSAPNDTEIMAGLSDVLLWQGRPEEALPVLDRARDLAPHDCDLLMRRTRVLRALGDLPGARAQLADVLLLNPGSAEARNAMQQLRAEPRHELRLGTEIDTFSFADAALAQTIQLLSRWTSRWSSDISLNSYQRFSHTAGKFSARGTLRFTQRDWLMAGAAAARENAIHPPPGSVFRIRSRLSLCQRLIQRAGSFLPAALVVISRRARPHPRR